MSSVARLPIEERTSGYLNHLNAAAEPSLYRNGKVLSRRDADGSDAGMEGVNRERLQEVIRNARLDGERRCTLASAPQRLRDFAKHSPRHRWFYYPAITRDEALLIKQWDSAGPMARSQGGKSDATDPESPCTFGFHSAFEDPSTPPDAPDRWSIEVRCMMIYEQAAPA